MTNLLQMDEIPVRSCLPRLDVRMLQPMMILWSGPSLWFSGRQMGRTTLLAMGQEHRRLILSGHRYWKWCRWYPTSDILIVSEIGEKFVGLKISCPEIGLDIIRDNQLSDFNIYSFKKAHIDVHIHVYVHVDYCLKVHLHEIFYFCFFSSKAPTWSPDTYPKFNLDIKSSSPWYLNCSSLCLT